MALLGKKFARFLRSAAPQIAAVASQAVAPGNPLAAALAAGGTKAAQGGGLGKSLTSAGTAYIGSSILGGGNSPYSAQNVIKSVGNSVGGASSTAPSFLKSSADSISNLIPSKESISGIFGGGATDAAATAGTLGGTDAEKAFLENIASSGASSTPSQSGLAAFLDRNKSIINTGTALGGLGLQAMQGSKTSAAEKALKANAASAQGVADSLTNTLASGKLPAGVETGIMRGYDAAKTQIRNKYANLGLSGSTMETQELADLDQRLAAQKFDTSLNLTNAGLSAADIANSTYTALVNKEISDDSALQNAIARLVGNYSSSQGAANG